MTIQQTQNSNVPTLHDWVKQLEKILQTLWDGRREAPELISETPEMRIVLKTEPKSGQYGVVRNVLVLLLQKGELTTRVCLGGEYSQLSCSNRKVDTWGGKDIPFMDRWANDHGLWLAGNLTVVGLRALAPDTEIPPRPPTHWDALEVR